MSITHAKRLGDFGELVAVRFLRDRGIRVVGRNVFVQRHEIDIIYRGDEGLVAVEVKTTSGERDPFDALDGEKLRRIRRAMAAYEQPMVAIDAIGVRICRSEIEIRWLRGVC